MFYCITPTERHSKCLEIAVENGADINNISKEGIPVLMFACETASENEDTCILMMEKGAEPNAKQEVRLTTEYIYKFWLIYDAISD